MSKLRHFLAPMSSKERQQFAAGCGTSVGALRNVIYGQRNPGCKLCVAIERITDGAVSRREALLPKSGEQATG